MPETPLDLAALNAAIEAWHNGAPANPIMAAAPALIALARRVQQDAAREGTHAPDCHLWGRRHYDCLLGKYEASRAEITRLREACSRENEDISQVLGKVLGYPWFKDDRANFPDATEADGVCVGEHVAISLADEAAAKIARLRQALEAAGRRVRLLEAGESGLILGLYERMKKAEIAVDERDVELTRLRKRISELEGVSWSR